MCVLRVTPSHSFVLCLLCQLFHGWVAAPWPEMTGPIPCEQMVRGIRFMWGRHQRENETAGAA